MKTPNIAADILISATADVKQSFIFVTDWTLHLYRFLVVSSLIDIRVS